MRRTTEKRTFDSMAAAASGLGIPLATLRKLKAQGAAGFENGRVNAPKLSAWMDAHPQTAEATQPPAKPNTLPTGAGSALVRLEQQEAACYQTMNAAVASGDTDEIERTRKAWLEVSEQLRKGDLAVEVARRSGQEMIPRDSIEGCLAELLNTWATALKLQLVNIGYNITKFSPDEARAILDTVAHEGLREAIVTARTWHADRPAWLYAAVLQNLRHTYSKEQMKAMTP